MTKKSDDGGSVEVFDLNMAGAYYACVFDAEIDRDMAGRVRGMQVGARRYRLKAGPAGGENAPVREAPVEDVDVSIARVATKGGRIVQPAETVGRARKGRVVDPFGHVWDVSGDGA